MKFILVSLALLAFALGSAVAAQPSELRRQINKAGTENNAQGATMLCTYLNQAIMLAGQKRLNKDAVREYEEMLHIGQELIETMTSPEATKTFIMGLNRMHPQGQVALAMGLCKHPSSPELKKASARLLQGARDFQVQVAAMKLLAAHHTSEGLKPILNNLKENKLVSLQIGACRALAELRNKDGIPPLIEYLKKWTSSRMRYEATAALRAITGQPFSADASTWSGWWNKNGATFTPPENPNPKFNYELEQKPEKSEEEVTYYEIPLLENRVVFVLDVSGSMKFGGSPNRLDRARDELKNLIARLDKQTQFNIILYNLEVKRWNTQQALVPATDVNKKGAAYFLDQAEAKGGTATMASMEEALYEVALVNGVETIFLISDGVPMPMKHWWGRVRSNKEVGVGAQAIRRRIRYVNQTLMVRIHTIGIFTRIDGDPPEPAQEAMRSFLKGVAEDNDGIYKEVK